MTSRFSHPLSLLAVTFSLSVLPGEAHATSWSASRLLGIEELSALRPPTSSPLPSSIEGRALAPELGSRFARGDSAYTGAMAGQQAGEQFGDEIVTLGDFRFVSAPGRDFVRDDIKR